MNPTQYRDHPKAKTGESCRVCGCSSEDPVIDHCNAHGWVRGVVCRSCNSNLGLVDGHVKPQIPSARVKDLLAHVARCHECPSVNEGSLVALSDPDSRAYTAIQFKNNMGKILDDVGVTGLPVSIRRRAETIAIVVPRDLYERMSEAMRK